MKRPWGDRQRQAHQPDDAPGESFSSFFELFAKARTDWIANSQERKRLAIRVHQFLQIA